MPNTIINKMVPFAQKGYCCSQILLLLALESGGRSNPDLVRSMAGLCNGLGYSGEMCGVLSGGACLMAFYAGKGTDEEQQNEYLTLMISELVEWFREKIGGKYGGISCREILGENSTKKPDQNICGDILVETYVMTTAILESNGFNT